MKEAYFFSHDSNARNDFKIKAMMSKYGFEGYGVYWSVIEMMREQEDYEIPMEEYFFMAMENDLSGCTLNFREFLEDCINIFKLFDSDGETFWSNSLKRRMEKKDEVKQKRREAAQKRWGDDKSTTKDDKKNAEKCKSNANAMQNSAKEKKEKERKGKEKKEKENIKEKEKHYVEREENLNPKIIEIPLSNSPDKAVFKKPTEGEVKGYFVFWGSKRNDCLDKEVLKREAELFYNHYESNGWKVGANAMEDWRAKIRGWIIEKEQKLKESKASESSKQKGVVETGWDDHSLEEMLEYAKSMPVHKG